MPERKRYLVAITAAGLLATGCASTQIAGTATPSGTPTSASPGSFPMFGVLTLTDAGTAERSCIGTGGYADIRSGTGITVTDAAGVVVAIGSLDAPTSTAGNCFYSFMIKDVPRGLTFYSVQISQRGTYNYTEDEARQTICLSLGS